MAIWVIYGYDYDWKESLFGGAYSTEEKAKEAFIKLNRRLFTTWEIKEVIVDKNI